MLSSPGTRICLIDGRRTPFGKFGGSMGELSPLEMAYLPTKETLEKTDIKPEEINQVLFANVVPVASDTLYAARHLALKLGCPQTTPALMLNRLCGSGLEAINMASRLIKLGEAECVLVAGAESMSGVPHLIYGARFGTRYGNPRTADFLLDTLSDKQAGCSMGQTAENLAGDYQVTREDSDRFSVHSHIKASQAYANGKLQGELVPVTVGKKTISKDEHLREDANYDDMSKLRATFVKDGTVTAASASGVVDGGAAVIIASEEFCKRKGIKPLAYIGLTSVVGVDPSRMGIGPVPAVEALLKKENKSLSDIDLIELNEAFAPQALACIKALKFSSEKVNIWGGAVALGHPLGATGIRLALTLARQLKDQHKRFGIATACIGGGQGIATLVERYDS